MKENSLKETFYHFRHELFLISSITFLILLCSYNGLNPSDLSKFKKEIKAANKGYEGWMANVCQEFFNKFYGKTNLDSNTSLILQKYYMGKTGKNFSEIPIKIPADVFSPLVLIDSEGKRYACYP